MKKTIIIYLLLITILTLSGSETKDKIIISLDDYIKIVKEKLPEFKHNEIVLDISKNDVIKQWGTHDVLLSGRINQIGKKNYADGNPVNLYYSEGFKGEGYLSTVIPSGTRLSIGGDYTQMYSWGYTKNDMYTLLTGMGVPESTIGPEYDHFIATTWDPAIKIQIAQPLLYNWFGFLDRFGVKNAKMNLAVEKLKKIENDNELLIYYQKLYFYWYQYKNILIYLDSTIKNAKILEAHTAEMYKSGVVENDNYQRAKYSIFKYMELYNATDIEYKKILNELSLILDLEKLNPLDTEFEKNLSGYAAQDILFVDFEKTRASNILNLQKDNLDYIKKARINQMMPELNLFGNIDIKFHQYRKDPRGNTSTEVKYESSNADVDFIVGIEFRYPLGNIKEKSEYNETKLQLKDLILQYDITRNNYTKGLNSVIDSIKLLNKIIELKNQGLDSLKSRLKTEERKYNQARLDLMTKIETENQIASEEIDLMKAKVNLLGLYLDYNKLTE